MALDEKTVYEQIRKLEDSKRWFRKSEILYLPKIMNEDEKIKAIMIGMYNHFAQMLYRSVQPVKHGKRGSRGKQISCFIGIRLKPGCKAEF